MIGTATAPIFHIANNEIYWKIDFSDQEREQWTNKIGNLVLISRKKNSSQGRMDFSDKKTKYFKNNIELFRNSLKIYTNYTKWTPTEINKNQQEVLKKIERHYG